MTAPVDATATAAAPKPAAKPKESVAEIKKAALQFEAILLRQMLGAAKVAGKGNYADMGVEALATSITEGGGIGLGSAITRSLAPDHPAPPGTAPASPVAVKRLTK